MNNILSGDLNYATKQFSLYPSTDFLESITPVEERFEKVKSLAREILNVLNQKKYAITFKMTPCGEAFIRDSSCSIIYLNAIDLALRIFKLHSTAPLAVSFYLNRALIDDARLSIITNLIKDRIIGAFDPTYTCRIDLRYNQLSSTAILNLANQIFKSDVWMLDVRGHVLDTATIIVLTELASHIPAELKNELNIPKDSRLLPRLIYFNEFLFKRT